MKDGKGRAGLNTHTAQYDIYTRKYVNTRADNTGGGDCELSAGAMEATAKPADPRATGRSDAVSRLRGQAGAARIIIYVGHRGPHIRRIQITVPAFFCPNGLVGPNCIVPQLFGGAAAEVADDCFNVACVAARHQMNMIGQNSAGQNMEIRLGAGDGETVGD